MKIAEVATLLACASLVLLVGFMYNRHWKTRQGYCLPQT